MATRKQLALFVEGAGDEAAVPVLVKHFLTQAGAWAWLSLGPVLKVGEIPGLVVRDYHEWLRYLKVLLRPNLGGVLAVLDGDYAKLGGRPFCAAEVARELALRARGLGAGQRFSVAVVVACQEYESWLLGGLPSLAGRPLPDGRPGVPAGLAAPPDPERAPRGAKEWLAHNLPGGYKPTVDQEPYTRLLLQAPFPEALLRMRSFLRLQRAVPLLAEAIRDGRHVTSPTPPKGPAGPTPAVAQPPGA